MGSPRSFAGTKCSSRAPFTAAVSSSRLAAKHAPTAFTCAPGAIQSPSRTGVGDAVVVQMMSAPETAASAVATGSIYTLNRDDIRSANARAAAR